MELLQLKYFVIVARLEHMTRAAEELGIAQPALSKTIATLEKSLGVLLFDRHGKYIRLNQNGKIFLKRAEQALTALEDGKRELADLSEETFGVIKLAVIVGSNLLPDLLSSFRLQYPHIKFNVLESFSRSVSGSDFDLCISSSTFKLVNTQTLDQISLLKAIVLRQYVDLLNPDKVLHLFLQFHGKVQLVLQLFFYILKNQYATVPYPFPGQ